MSDFAQQSRAGAAGTTASSTRPSPGKRTRSEALPAREPRHHEMTGIPLVDQGLYCDRPEAEGDEGCYLEPQQQSDMLTTIVVDANAVGTAIQAAISDVKDEVRGQGMEWGLSQEIITMGVLLAVGGAFGAAFAGASFAARIEKATAFLGKGVRAEVMHGGSAPASDDDYLTYARDVQSATAQAIVQSVAELGLDHDGMQALHRALTDKSVIGQAVLQRQIRAQLAMFKANNVASLGGKMFDREVAVPVIVRHRRHSYIVLCRAFGIKNSALALNGANIDNDEEPLTMESLDFVRIVEPAMHSLMLSTWRARRSGEKVTELNFNSRADRDKVRWEHTFKLELDHHPDPAGVMYERGDVDAPDPDDRIATTQ